MQLLVNQLNSLSTNPLKLSRLLVVFIDHTYPLPDLMILIFSIYISYSSTIVVVSLVISDVEFQQLMTYEQSCTVNQITTTKDLILLNKLN